MRWRKVHNRAPTQPELQRWQAEALECLRQREAGLSCWEFISSDADASSQASFAAEVIFNVERLAARMKQEEAILEHQADGEYDARCADTTRRL
jgi:hypothetical protein